MRKFSSSTERPKIDVGERKNKRMTQIIIIGEGEEDDKNQQEFEFEDFLEKNSS